MGVYPEFVFLVLCYRLWRGSWKPGCTFVHMSGFIIAASNKEISVWKRFLGFRKLKFCCSLFNVKPCIS